jgi:hypothetical protein
MSCCGGQPLAYLRREVPDGRDVGLRAQDAYEVADVADADWPAVAPAAPLPSGRSSSSNRDRYRSSASRRSSVLACCVSARCCTACANR